jgi:hypothetical protein
VKDMSQKKVFVLVVALLAGACSDSGEENASEIVAESPATTAPEAGSKPGRSDGQTIKLQGPVSISYKIIGAPIVGQAVAVDLQVVSNVGAQAITLTYRVNDTTAMQFPEAQPPSVSMAATDSAEPQTQQVRIIPLREGRLFLNVSASIETDGGTISTVTAIPIQVGSAVQQPQEKGTVTTDENGEAIRVLSGES